MDGHNTKPNDKEKKLTTYETHKLIKEAIPDANTVYEKEHKGQMTIDEWIDITTREQLEKERGQYEYEI